MAQDRLVPNGVGTPLVRYGLIAVVIVNVLNGVLTGFLQPAHPLPAVAYAAAFASVLIVTSPGDRPLGALSASAAVLTAVTSAALTWLYYGNEVTPALAGFATVPIALLAVRGNLIAAGLGVATQTGLILTWASISGIPAAEMFSQHLIVHIAAPIMGFLLRFLLIWIVREENRHREIESSSQRATFATRRATQLLAEDLRSAHAEVQPMLTLIRDGDPIDDAVRREISAVEASTRDRIRTPRLQTTELNLAIRRARERGVSVVLLGEASDPRPVIGASLAHAVSVLLESQNDGEVIVRIPPARSEDALTMLLRSSEHVSSVAFDRRAESLGADELRHKNPTSRGSYDGCAQRGAHTS